MPTDNELTFPQVWDATMLRAAKGCDRKLYWEFFRNKVATGLNPDLNAGAAWARALEVFRKCYYGETATPAPSKDDAAAEAFIAMAQEYGDEEFDPPKDNPKQFDRLAEALVEYLYYAYPPEMDEHRPYLLSDGSPAVEFSFAEPIEEVLHPETGEPLLYAGTFDMLDNFHNMLYVFDDKTSKQMGPSWSRQWHLRSQFIGYVWGARRFGFDAQGAWVRGTAFKKTTIDFADTKVGIPKWMVEDWYQTLIIELRRIIEAWKEGYFRKNYDETCTMYGGCQYLPLCEIPDAHAEDFLSGFEDRTWSPVKMDSQ